LAFAALPARAERLKIDYVSRPIVQSSPQRCIPRQKVR
jgi:hypothetical protein